MFFSLKLLDLGNQSALLKIKCVIKTLNSSVVKAPVKLLLSDKSGGGCRCHIQIKKVLLDRKDLISSPSQDRLPALNIYLSLFQGGDTTNYGRNSHGYREQLS